MTYGNSIIGVVFSLLSMAAGAFLFENPGILSNQSGIAIACWLGGMLAFVASIAASFSVDPHRKKA